MCCHVCDCRHVRVAARMQILPMASAEQRKHQYNFNPFRRTTAKHKWKHECTHAATHTHTHICMDEICEGAKREFNMSAIDGATWQDI